MEPKKLFVERINALLGEESNIFFDYTKKLLKKIIRVNLLKISRQDLIEKLKNKGWEIQNTAYRDALEIKSKLLPGQLGKALEHHLGYYYIQELASMMPPLILEPKAGEIILDCCAAPGSKTTQIAMMMKNQGTIIANDVKIDRLKALVSNLERCGVMNTIVTRMNALTICKKLAKSGFFFDKILVDAPCSGEGTIRGDSTILKMWNINMIKRLSALQKKLISSAIECLKPQGTLVYSTCTLTPEENESVIDFALKNFNVRVEKIKLPLKTRPGIVKWQGQTFNEQVKNCHRIWPQDNNTEGFFIAKLRKIR
ncbi:MAG: RsmB/NOP family class I SAM-dependent RNA methyltransferase [Candidatus Pacearchaeota archaeon]|nr:MAG: RsmB/NOP family class I SAM-dependent RNA methyltransferase [Candidatus Pacearchaeota archaeon]